MAAEREAPPSADVVKTNGPGNIPESSALSKRSTLPWRLAALATATAVIVAVGVFGSSPLAAKTPPKAKPINWSSIAKSFQTMWKQFVPKSLTKLSGSKSMPKMKQLKAASTIPKSLLKQPAIIPQAQPKLRQIAGVPNAIVIPSRTATKQLPQLNQAYLELIEAWRHMHAAHLPAKVRTAALTNLGQALIALGGASPKPLAGGKKIDHIAEAQGHLTTAEKEVLAAKYVPTALRKSLLEQIRNAQGALDAQAKPAAGKAAPPGK